MKFRHELKYLINPGDAALLKERLQVVLRPDEHAVDGQYHIRSLYFDDYWDTAYRDKLGGFPERRKYRIRVYNRGRDVIRLECKRKSASYICKTSAALSEEELGRIWQGDYGFLLRREETLCREFYYQCVSRVMRPRVYVDYEREPFVMEAGDVRITFDRDVRGALICSVRISSFSMCWSRESWCWRSNSPSFSPGWCSRCFLSRRRSSAPSPNIPFAVTKLII